MVQTANAAVPRVGVPAPARSLRPAAPPAKPGPAAPSGPGSPSLTRSGPGRRTPPRLRTFFLRHFRACGEVKRAAERTGVAVSTLYRWRDRDEDFRERWDSLADQRRQMIEDRLMGLALEGEKTAVFYKGEQVGWRVSHTARAAIALLAYFDRREKAARAEVARQEANQKDDGQDADWDDDERAEREERAREERMRAHALASRSAAATEAKERAESDSSSAEDRRKIGNGPALPAFDRDRVAVATPDPASRASQMPQVPQAAQVPRLPNGQPWDDPATARRKTQELLDLHYPDRRPQMLPDNWKPYGMG